MTEDVLLQISIFIVMFYVGWILGARWYRRRQVSVQDLANFARVELTHEGSVKAFVRHLVEATNYIDVEGLSDVAYVEAKLRMRVSALRSLREVVKRNQEEREDCERCRGTGVYPTNSILGALVCKRCNGLGQVRVTEEEE